MAQMRAQKIPQAIGYSLALGCIHSGLAVAIHGFVAPAEALLQRKVRKVGAIGPFKRKHDLLTSMDYEGVRDTLAQPGEPKAADFRSAASGQVVNWRPGKPAAHWMLTASIV